jgi:GxxExxY protein
MNKMIGKQKYDLAGEMIGLAMKVHRALGAGFLESVYVKALQHEILRAGYVVELEAPVKVRYDGIVVGDFFADLLVYGELIVEVKAVASLVPAHEVQLVNYLAATGLDEGLLLNFGTASLEFKKKFRVYKPAGDERVRLHEDYENFVNSVQKKS